MAASFPTSIKAFTSKTDGVDDILASHVNDLQDEIAAIEGYGGGWTPAGETWTYVSATSFRIAGDVTAKYQPGDKLKLTQTTVKYFYVLSAVYGAPNTTITVTAGSDYSVANAPITAPYFSKAASPQSFPDWFNWAPTLTGWSTVPPTAFYRFKIQGRSVHVMVDQTGASVSNTTGITITAPVTSANINAALYFGAAMWSAADNGSYLTTPGRAILANNSANILCYTNFTSGGWTNSGAKLVAFNLVYEF